MLAAVVACAAVACTAVATPLAAQRARGTRATGTRTTGTRSTGRAAAPAAAARPESTYLATQVDTLAEPNPATFVPRYPPALRARGVRGTVVVQFVVDTAGRPDMGTFKVLSSSDTAFTTAVRTAVARTDFLPALLDGRKVRQLYEQPFTFAVDEVARPRTRDTSVARP
ncbi:hypothetical protein tb265_12470 [Gemmatimonadetes bacterium T265]|nr:hypothetical protein tb265_12470 [Gemmatimonadetes bacterium T265]